MPSCEFWKVLSVIPNVPFGRKKLPSSGLCILTVESVCDRHLLQAGCKPSNHVRRIRRIIVTQTQSATSSVQSSSRVRAPSATMSLVLVGQIQFLATLSLVESTGADDSWILDFAKHLRSGNVQIGTHVAPSRREW